MSDFSKMMIGNIVKNTGTRLGAVIPGEQIPGIDSLNEWIKWLSYKPSFEQEKITSISLKTVTDLTIDDLETLLQYKKEEKMTLLFKKYKSNECTADEFMEVYNYMSNSITDLMLRKLTRSELEAANMELSKFNDFDTEKLDEKVKTAKNEEDYNALSMIDSYVVHMLAIKKVRIKSKGYQKSLTAELRRNNAMHYKNLLK